jgi:hypothetical protein
MKDKGIWVVEFRLAFEVRNARDALDAAWKGKESLKRNMDIDLGVEHARVFEYETDEKICGPVNEWFANPSGTNFRKIDANYESHLEIINDRKDNQDGSDKDTEFGKGQSDSEHG